MSASADRAKQLYLEEGYCCAEAIWLTFAERDKLSEEETALGNKLTFAFCGGTGAKNLCGAAAGGALVLGNHFGRIPGQPRNEDLPRYTKALIEAFENRYSHTSCLKLKPSTDSASAKQVCAGYVGFITKELELLLENGLPSPAAKESCAQG
jgi:C_GCAxxG_C_C family probable redox protein